MDEFLNNIHAHILVTEHQEVLDAPIQLSEVMQAIDILKLNKTPGPDGFTTEFYFF